MRLAIAVSRANVEQRTGGPFGAAIFEAPTGRLVSIGMNSVVRYQNCTLHAEMVAFMMAQRLVKLVHAQHASTCRAHELFTSCEPCAMCLGATLWSGVRRVVYGAGREDASRLKFEEGPVFPESYKYLEDRGLVIVRNVLREEARAVMDLYRAKQRGDLQRMTTSLDAGFLAEADGGAPRSQPGVCEGASGREPRPPAGPHRVRRRAALRRRLGAQARRARAPGAGPRTPPTPPRSARRSASRITRRSTRSTSGCGTSWRASRSRISGSISRTATATAPTPRKTSTPALVAAAVTRRA